VKKKGYQWGAGLRDVESYRTINSPEFQNDISDAVEAIRVAP